MATYKEASDGPPYIVKGYPLTIGGEEETRYCSYRVLGRAEELFRLAGFRDRQQIPKELFYALVVDGDITNERLEKHPPTISSIPRSILDLVEGFDDYYKTLLGLPGILQAQHVLDLYRIVSAIPKLNQKRDAVLLLASFFFLAQRLREYETREKFTKNNRSRPANPYPAALPS